MTSSSQQTRNQRTGRRSSCFCFPTERRPPRRSTRWKRLQKAKAAGVPVYTIALGTDAGTVEVTDELGMTQTVAVPPDRETLAEIARVTGASAFSAPTQQALDAVYDRLSSSIGYEKELREVTYAFAASGFVLLLVAGALSALWFNRLP